MTEPLNELPELDNKNSIQKIPGIQCALCLHEIALPLDPGSQQNKHWIQCPRCNYHQPLSKIPRARDLAIFASVIGAVYITTIVAVLITR